MRRRAVRVAGTVRAAGQTRILAVAAAIVVLLLVRLARVVGQHEVLRERRRFTANMRNARAAEFNGRA